MKIPVDVLETAIRKFERAARLFRSWQVSLQRWCKPQDNRQEDIEQLGYCADDMQAMANVIRGYLPPQEPPTPPPAPSQVPSPPSKPAPEASEAKELEGVEST